MTLPTIPTGVRLHQVTFQDPGTLVADGQGGFTESWINLVPSTLFVRIQPASAADLERIMAGTVSASATHLVIGPYHPGVNTKTRMLWTDYLSRAREFSVAGVMNPLERNLEMILLCEERVTEAPPPAGKPLFDPAVFETTRR